MPVALYSGAASSRGLASILSKQIPDRIVTVSPGAPPPTVELGFLVVDEHSLSPEWLLEWRNACTWLVAILPACDDSRIQTLLDHDVDEIFISGDDLGQRLARFLGIIRRRSNRSERERVIEELMARHGLNRIVGSSPLTREAVGRIPQYSRTMLPLLIEGETGTGKELFARAIHYLGPAAQGPFIPVNCGCLPDNLLENELFGHEAGAYTDARERSSGLLHAAQDGTLFLDEVNSLSPGAQAKLLRVIEEGRYKPLGRSGYVESNARILTAANKPLAAHCRDHLFRDDLYYRISVLRLELAPLRRRKEEIPELARHFLSRCAPDPARGRLRLSASATNKLCAWDWPGNVRELRNVIERAAVTSLHSVIRGPDIDLPEGEAENPATYHDAKRRALERFESAFVQRALSVHDGNVTHAARASGTDRRSFQRLMRKHRIN